MELLRLLDKNMQKTNFKIYLFTFALLFSLSAVFPLSTQAITDKEKEQCQKFKEAFEIKVGNSSVDGNFINDIPSFCSADAIALRAIEIGLALSGIVAVAFIVIGGYFYLTSAGNEEQIEKGKKILINAVIGLVIIMLAVVIVRIVAKTVQGDLPAPTASTGGSTGGNNFTDPGGSGTNPGTDPGPIDPDPGDSGTDLASLVDLTIPPKVYSSGVYTVTARISSANASEFTSVCGASPASSKAAMTLQLDGNVVGGTGNFFLVNSNGSSYYQAQVNVTRIPDTTADGGQLAVRVCNQEIASPGITFEKPAVSPRGSAEMVQAAKDFEWNVDWSSDFLVTIDNSSINNSRINTLCSGTATADKNIVIKLNDKTAPDDVTGKNYFPISQRVFHINLVGDYDKEVNVYMFICGNPVPEIYVTEPG